MFHEGWKTREGRQISRTSILRILSDCFYCGEFKWKREHYHADNVKNGIKHKPLISNELFNRVQKRIKDREDSISLNSYKK